MAYKIKQNDTRPILKLTLQQTNPADPTGPKIPVDLTAATAVKLLMKKDTTLKVNAAMTVDNAVNGQVSYSWIPADTTEDGTWNIEVEVSWGVDKATFPSEGYATVLISPDLG